MFAARDLDIPFAQLKCTELGGTFCSPQTTAKGMSLSRAIRGLKPAMSKDDVKNAKEKAKAEAKSVSQTAKELFLPEWAPLSDQITGNSDRRDKGERRSATSQAPPLLRQRKPYLIGSPPSRQERRCRGECRVVRV